MFKILLLLSFFILKLGVAQANFEIASPEILVNDTPKVEIQGAVIPKSVIPEPKVPLATIKPIEIRGAEIPTIESPQVEINGADVPSLNNGFAVPLTTSNNGGVSDSHSTHDKVKDKKIKSENKTKEQRQKLDSAEEPFGEFESPEPEEKEEGTKAKEATDSQFKMPRKPKKD